MFKRDNLILTRQDLDVQFGLMPHGIIQLPIHFNLIETYDIVTHDLLQSYCIDYKHRFTIHPAY